MILYNVTLKTLQYIIPESVKLKSNIHRTSPLSSRCYSQFRLSKKLHPMGESSKLLSASVHAGLKQFLKISFTDSGNIYGPTEATFCVSVYQIKTIYDITIGKPIANTQIYIVDKYLKPTPIGVTGELCIAGDGVDADYLNRTELTAEKFIDNPFGKGKLYKTGDLAYWREDGNIVYVGRNDLCLLYRCRGIGKRNS